MLTREQGPPYFYQESFQLTSSIQSLKWRMEDWIIAYNILHLGHHLNDNAILYSIHNESGGVPHSYFFQQR